MNGGVGVPCDFCSHLALSIFLDSVSVAFGRAGVCADETVQLARLHYSHTRGAFFPVSDGDLRSLENLAMTPSCARALFGLPRHPHAQLFVFSEPADRHGSFDSKKPL